MASTQLTKTFANNGNRKTMTFSFWVKRGTLGTNQYPFSIYDSSSGLQADIRFITTDIHRMYATDTSTNTSLSFQTNRVFRDTSAWYHIVWAIDTTQATESNRVKLYVNGVQETSFSQAIYPSQNLDLRWNGNDNGDTGGVNYIGAINGGNYLDGSMSHINFIDGTAYDASYFGEFDANGVWTINTSPSVTYGTNGYFILKDGNSVTDQSGNSNDWTVGGGTLTNTLDCPDNVFCTMNPLIPSNGVFSEGNTTVTTTSSSWCTIGSTYGVTSGKWYWEVKANLLSGSTSNFYTMIGFVRLQGNSSDIGSNTTSHLGSNNGVGIYSANGNLYYPSSSTSYGSGYQTSGTIIGISLDLTNNYAYWSIDGTWQNSGDPESGATGTGGYNLSSFADGSFISPASSVQNYSSSNKSENEYNFGSPPFAISSGNTDGNGFGNFEYAVPTGYLSLNTKNLAAVLA